ncbi:MAG: ABC transporter permease, partial [Candidatus Thorarchaeota archaeon]|jgi:ABC-type multidrug transport system permease subunit
MRWLLKKEVKSVIRSRWLMLGFIISPLFAWMFQGVFISFIVGQTAEEPEAVYVTLEDDGVWGQTLYAELERYKDDLLFDPLVNVTREFGEAMVANKTVSVWMLIPENFTENLETTNTTSLVIWVNSANIRATAAAERLDNFARWVINEYVKWLEVDRNSVSPEATFGHQMAVFLVMLTSVLAPAPYVSKSFAMSRLRILISKLLAGLFLTMIYSVFTIVGILFYNFSIISRAASLPPDATAFFVNLYTVDPVTIPLIFFCQFLILLCAISIGVVISTLAKDQATAESLNNLIMLIPTMVIGILGFAGSISQYGGIFGFLVMLVPFSHAIVILNGILSGVATPLSLLGNISYLLGFTIVFLIIGAKLFEREAIIA